MKKNFYKICTQCYFFCRVEEGDQYCSICGTKLITECESCKEKIDNPYAEYCKSCGQKYRKTEKENNSYNF